MNNRDVLMIAGVEGIEHCAHILAEELGSRVEVAATRKAALAALTRSEFGVVVVEENLVEGDGEWADRLWQCSGLAVPLQVNFSLSGCARLVREVKSALARREGEQVIARRAAMAEVEDDLKSSVTGLLLASELALREPTASAALAPKLKRLVELAGDMRERLDARQRKPGE